MPDNRLQKSLEEAYINNDAQYNFGGWVPLDAFIQPSPSPTPSITPTISLTPTITPTPTPSSIPPLDPDATAYILEVNNQGGSLSIPQETAIYTFFDELKSNGLYNKFYYLHLFLGGTEGSNGLNVVNLGTYDLTWNGTWAHSMSGSSTTQNNSNYAQSGFLVSSSSPSTTLTNFSMGYMVGSTNRPISSFQYQGIGTSSSNYMVIGHDLVQPPRGWIQNFWSVLPGNLFPSSTITNNLGLWNCMSRSGATSWYSAVKANGTLVSVGLDFELGNTSPFTPSATAFDINLFRINGLNNFTIGGRAILNYTSTYISPAEMATFMEICNDLQVAFGRNIFTP